MGWWITATLCAFFVKGLCGFANSLVFSAILSFGNNNVNITPVELILGCPTNAWMAWRGRDGLKLKVWFPLSLLVIGGSIPGAFLLKNVHTGTVKIVFGIVIILLGIEMFFREFHSKKMKSSKAVLGVIGVASGVLCGLYGIGALLGAYIGRVTDDTSEFKANICMVFFIENTFRIITYVASGIMNLGTVKTAFPLVLFMVLGLWLGTLSSKALNDKTAKKIVILMLVVSGVALVVNNMM